MDTVSHYFRSIFSLTYFVFDWFKRLAFWRKGTYRDQESLLPVTVNNTNKSAQFNYSSSSIVNTYNTNINNNWNLINNRHPNPQVKQDDQAEEINYFEDMKPSLNRQKKVGVVEIHNNII